MGQIVKLYRYQRPDDAERAFVRAAELEALETARLAARREADRAWRNRPREPKPLQLDLFQ